MRLTSAVVLCLAGIAGCGNGVRHNWPPSYHHDTMHLGIVKREAGARAASLAGAGRSAGLGAEAAITNPAALAGISKPSLSAGAGYVLSDLTVRPSWEDAQAQSFFGSWSPAYLAAATPVAARRFVVGASLWDCLLYTSPSPRDS